MAQKKVWENEYRKTQLIVESETPRQDVKDFVRFLRKQEGVVLEGLSILDLGCGTGKNSVFLAKRGNNVVGIDISETAIQKVQKFVENFSLSADYRVGNIGEPYPFEDGHFDIVLDVMSSNSLDEKERAIYLKEVHRVLRPGGYFFVRALCKEGDKNAKNLVKMYPGPEKDTYTVPDIGLTERVFTEDDFRRLYEPFFEIMKLEKKTNYATFQGQTYKRNYWLAYIKKRLCCINDFNALLS